MKILLLCSGGDAPGMNSFIYSFLNKNRSHQIYGAIAGFKGLINGDFVKLDKKQAKKHKNNAGAYIKTSRCPEFKTKKGVQKAVENITKNGFDCLVVLGGDGSYKGCKELVQNNINVIFVPTTIDRDLNYDTYSIGFLTAVFACCEHILKVMNSFESLDRTGVFEVMGRHNSSICNLVSEIVSADLKITGDNVETYDLSVLNTQKKSQIIVVQENLLDLNEFALKIQNQIGSETRTSIIGYIQRGYDPLKEEQNICNIFASMATKLIKQKQYNVAISLNENYIQTLPF